MSDNVPALIDSAIRVWSELAQFRRENSRVSGIPKGIEVANQLAAGGVDLEELVATAEKAKSTESIAFALYTASQVKTDNAISVIKRYLNDNRKVRIGTGSFVIAKAVGELAWRFLFEAAPKEVEKICSMKSQLRQE